MFIAHSTESWSIAVEKNEYSVISTFTFPKWRFLNRPESVFWGSSFIGAIFPNKNNHDDICEQPIDNTFFGSDISTQLIRNSGCISRHLTWESMTSMDQDHQDDLLLLRTPGTRRGTAPGTSRDNQQRRSLTPFLDCQGKVKFKF